MPIPFISLVSIPPFVFIYSNCPIDRLVSSGHSSSRSRSAHVDARCTARQEQISPFFNSASCFPYMNTRDVVIYSLSCAGKFSGVENRLICVPGAGSILHAQVGLGGSGMRHEGAGMKGPLTRGDACRLTGDFGGYGWVIWYIASASAFLCCGECGLSDESSRVSRRGCISVFSC